VALREDVPMVVKRCPYPDERHQRWMNVSGAVRPVLFVEAISVAEARNVSVSPEPDADLGVTVEVDGAEVEAGHGGTSLRLLAPHDDRLGRTVFADLPHPNSSTTNPASVSCLFSMPTCFLVKSFGPCQGSTTLM
jgi:hypothetical protein